MRGRPDSEPAPVESIDVVYDGFAGRLRGHMPDMAVRRRLEQRRVSVSLPTDDTAPAKARRSARSVLDQWDLDHLRDTLLVVVSELVTNAVRHGRPPVRMSFRYVDDRLTVGVHDSQPPTTASATDPGPEAESGRGLFIVSALGSITGSRDESNGKVIWVELDTCSQLPAGGQEP
jgi:anti-sigma regulatory factor (Ser/Thr protein kinase)